MKNDIHVPEDKSYTLSEVIDAVQRTLDEVSAHSPKNKLRYSPKDVYWLLHDMLHYVNQNVLGEFSLQQTRKGVYRLRYTAETAARRQSREKLKADINRTAKYLEELTGRRPTWGGK